ncbi:MAG: hypothetical protein ACK4VO_03685 [Pseudobdellovibrio sp.]
MKKSTFIIHYTIVLAVTLLSYTAQSRTKTRDIQEVNFAEMSLKGTIRNPDGAYLVQKKGIKFMPLHEVQQDMDKKIRETSLYID